MVTAAVECSAATPGTASPGRKRAKVARRADDESDTQAEVRLPLREIRQKFRQRGYCVLEGLLSAAELTALQRECSLVVKMARQNIQENSAAGERLPPDWILRHHGCIFQVPLGNGQDGMEDMPLSTSAEYCHARGAAIRGLTVGAKILFSDKLRQLVEYLLGGVAFLYNEQYIVKPPDCDRAVFNWHTDSEHRDPDVEYRPYISMWTALDDVHEENGTLYIQPYPSPHLAPSSGLSASSNRETEYLTEDSIHEACSLGYPDPKAISKDPDTGGSIPIILPKGSVVIMSDRVIHCSGGNLSNSQRRAWMPQFSRGPVLRHCHDNNSNSGKTPASLAVPLMCDRSYKQAD